MQTKKRRRNKKEMENEVMTLTSFAETVMETNRTVTGAIRLLVVRCSDKFWKGLTHQSAV
jgi:hypothetical protein